MVWIKGLDALELKLGLLSCQCIPLAHTQLDSSVPQVFPDQQLRWRGRGPQQSDNQ
jgi:hypothetical protein